MTWKVNFYQTARGEKPVEEFINSQDKSTYAKIIRLVDLLEKHGFSLRPPYSKKIVGKVYELRSSGQNPIRIFYTIRGMEFYLLHVFKKKSRKTPIRELRVAIDRSKKLI